jgi:predicted phage-related endonuclease
MAASLDAIDSVHQNAFEIKCGKVAYEVAANSNSIPTYYRAQLQHALMILKLPSMMYVAFRPNLPLIEIKVVRDDPYIEAMQQREKHFAEQLLKVGHTLQKEFVGEGRHGPSVQ